MYNQKEYDNQANHDLGKENEGSCWWDGCNGLGSTNDVLGCHSSIKYCPHATQEKLVKNFSTSQSKSVNFQSSKL